MKTHSFVILTLLLLLAHLTQAQGVFIDDQFSTTDPPLTTPPFGADIDFFQPGGQSFTPSFSSVGFIQLNLADIHLGNGLGATVHVVIHSDSITGPILGTSTSVIMADGFAGVPDFIFTTPVAVALGVTYYFQPIKESGGDTWGVSIADFGYSGGFAWYQGAALAGDLWFHEGIIVPEPSSAWLILMGGGFLFYVGRFRKSLLRN